MEMAFKNSLIEQAAEESGFQDLPELMTLYPTEEEFKDPLVYIEKMYSSLGDKEQGGVKIVPPASFKPPCVFNPDMDIETRFQTLQDLGQNIPFKENKSGMSFEDWKQQATTFQDEYKYKTEGKEDEDRVTRLERDYWNYIEKPKDNERVTVQYASDLDQAKFPSGFPQKKDGEAGIPQSDVIDYSEHPWNMTRTWKQKGSLLQFVKKQISGVTRPWTYSGMLFSTFCWHFEDLYLFSMNYMHQGASKIWYFIPDSDRQKFEKVAQEKLYERFKKDKNFMLDINTVINPTFIAAHG